MKNYLFLKLSAVLLFLLLLLGMVMGWISYKTAQDHYNEANQKLNTDLAQFTVDHVQTFKEDGSINEGAIQEIMHSMMVINPDVEVYLLDKAGEILKHVAPKKRVVRKRVDLNPIKSYLKKDFERCIEGDDPRSFTSKKIFSAAPIMENDKLQGYYYIILASQERASVLESLKSNFAVSFGLKIILLSFLIAFIFGLFAIWRFTKNLTPIESSMKAFEEGNYDSRINLKSNDFRNLADTYNSMADQIQMNIEKIRSVNNFRKEFIANISHDLRSPLMVIKGYTETLQIKKEDIGSDESQKYLNYILESSKQTEGLLNQLLELSKLENNQIEVIKEPFDLMELVSDILNRFEIILKRKNIVVDFVKDNPIPYVFADISLMERAVQNLLDNAIKYSPNNSKIILTLFENIGDIYCSIKDEGVGIEEKKLAKIFERYERGADVENENKSIGLGLAIVKRILEMHGANISVKSRINEGATFTFNIAKA